MKILYLSITDSDETGATSGTGPNWEYPIQAAHICVTVHKDKGEAHRCFPLNLCHEVPYFLSGD